MVGCTLALPDDKASGSASSLFSLLSEESGSSPLFQLRKAGWLLACFLIHDHSSLQGITVKLHPIGESDSRETLPRNPRIIADLGVRQ